MYITTFTEQKTEWVGARINVSEAVVPEELHYYIGPQWGEKGSEVAFQFPKKIYKCF